MFTINDLKKLKNAGVEDSVLVRIMLDDETEQQEQPEAAQQEQQEQPEAAKKGDVSGSDAILAAINKLTGAIQASNMRRDGIGGPEQSETADAILANLLYPKREG